MIIVRPLKLEVLFLPHALCKSIFSTYNPMMSRELPCTRSNAKVVGLPSMSKTVRYQQCLIFFAFLHSIPHPCSYTALCGDSTSSIPSSWHIFDSSSVPPVDVGAPLSSILLILLQGLSQSLSSFAEKTTVSCTFPFLLSFRLHFLGFHLSRNLSDSGSYSIFVIFSFSFLAVILSLTSFLSASFRLLYSRLFFFILRKQDGLSRS